MASSIKLYTTGNMEAAKVHNVTSEATGHPAENAIDNNLDTYWKPTSVATNDIDIDLGEAKAIDVALGFIKNYKSDFGTATFSIYWSDNGSDWNFISGAPLLTDITTPIRIRSFSSITHRYWRLRISSSTSAIAQISGIWFGSYYNIDQGNVLPQGDEDQFYNHVSQLPGGRLTVAGINRNYVENPSRRYLIKTGTPYTNLLSAFQDSRGRRHLLVMNEGATQTDARVVRFADDILPHPTVGYDGLYEIEIGLRGMPYIDDGDSY